MEKTCEWCEKVFSKPEKLNVKDWEKRRFCGHSCAARWRAGSSREVKTCEFCGVKFTKKAGPSNAWFSRQKYCGPECRGAAKRREMAEKERERMRRSDSAIRWGGQTRWVGGRKGKMPHGMGHSFGDSLHCECGTTWSAHQEERTVCELWKRAQESK